jgi:hypothetical protein
MVETTEHWSKKKTKEEPSLTLAAGGNIFTALSVLPQEEYFSNWKA